MKCDDDRSAAQINHVLVRFIVSHNEERKGEEGRGEELAVRLYSFLLGYSALLHPAVVHYTVLYCAVLHCTYKRRGGVGDMLCAVLQSFLNSFRVRVNGEVNTVSH